jgi:hypothetical protein
LQHLAFGKIALHSTLYLLHVAKKQSSKTRPSSLSFPLALTSARVRNWLVLFSAAYISCMAPLLLRRHFSLFEES